jgi:predicted phosphodiesterase
VTLPNKICLVADVHSNLAALEAVVQDAGEVDAWWCMGDVVGYGPDPNECVELMAGLGALIVAGNHDAGSIGTMSLSRFNMDARVAAEWTARTLSESSTRFLQALPETRYQEDTGCLLVHGSPSDPMWEYVTTVPQAEENFEAFTADVCFLGHSHVPVVFATPAPGSTEGVSQTTPADGETIELSGGRRYLANVGSVGQPRDGDPRASYVMFEPGALLITYYRVEYEVARTRRRMEQIGLPSFLSSRLALGR